MDVIRCLKAKIAKNVFNLTKFGDFCTILHESLQSQFFLATYKKLQFLAKNDQFWLGKDVTRWLKAEIAKNVFFWTKFGDFCTILRESHQSQFFLATYKKQNFSAKIELFWLGMDVNRCLKAKIVKNVFTLTKFGVFWTILHECHQSQFFLATYKNLHFLAKIDQFWIGMDVIRCLKAKNAEKVLTSTKFGDFCTILLESHQSQFFLATYKKQHFLAKIDQFRLGMDVTRWSKAAIAKKVFTSTKIGYFCTNFCMRVTKVSSFWPPTKSSIFRQKLSVFGQDWMLLGG